ncbi:MAG: response regulator [Bdellovibrionales bacterium]|nr:response regulator [Bdellovibrionales bacterium]
MRILIAEDQPATASILETILSGYGTCDVVDNGKKAVRAVERAFKERKPYDLICLDLMMPEMGGREALLTIRQVEKDNSRHSLSHYSKIMIVTAVSDTHNRAGALSDGAAVYITKPFRKDELIRQLKAMGFI